MSTKSVTPFTPTFAVPGLMHPPPGGRRHLERHRHPAPVRCPPWRKGQSCERLHFPACGNCARLPEQPKQPPRPLGPATRMRTLTIGDVTITSIIERDGPWRKPEDMFPAYDAALGRRYLAEMDQEVFDPASGRMVITYQ